MCGLPCSRIISSDAGPKSSWMKLRTPYQQAPGECMLSFILGFMSIPTTNAHNRFRWAVCQIDALQRLKCERHIVKNALENLPRTLDETYDRIFLRIPEEERLFVYHALQWISYHNELHGNCIPCSVLLQAVARSTAMLSDSQNVRF